MSVSLSSSTSESSFAHLHQQQHVVHGHHLHQDAVASVLTALHQQLRWRTSKIAKRLGVPEVAVDEAMRVGSSSSVLRAHFSSWAHESNEMPDGLPPGMVAAAIRQCDSALGAYHPTSGAYRYSSPGKSDSSSTLDDLGHGDAGDGLFDDALDGPMQGVPLGGGNNVAMATRHNPQLKEHFAFLRQSVGYNFMSILNDPTEPAAGRGGEWGSWFGSAVQDVFDYGNPHAGGTGPLQGPTSAQLLLTHTSLQGSSSGAFQPYLHYVGGVMEKRKMALMEFHRWREEVQRVQEGDGGGGARNASASSSGVLFDAHRHPWPTDIPAEFFAPDFSVAKLVVDTLPCEEAPAGTAPVPESMTDTLEALETGCSDLHRSLLRVEHCLFVHVQKRSDDFFAASHSFDDLHHDTEEALSDLVKTKDVLITRGDAVVSDYTNVAQLYRRRHHEQLLQSRVKSILELIKCWEFVDSWMATADRSDEMFPEVAVSLMKCQAMMYDTTNGVADLLGDLACARQLPLQVSRAKAGLTSMVITAGANALVASLQALLEPGGSIDWTPVTAPLDAAGVLGCLPQVLQQHQQFVLDNLWISTRQLISETYDAATVASVATFAVRVPHPKPERAEFLKPLRAFSAAAYSKLITKLLADVQHRIGAITNHWNAVRDYALELWHENATPSRSDAAAPAAAGSAGHHQHPTSPSSANAPNSSTAATTTGGSGPLPTALQPGSFEALLSIAAHHCVLDVITIRYEENGAMRIKDILPIIRHGFVFSHGVDVMTIAAVPKDASAAVNGASTSSKAAIAAPLPGVSRASGGRSSQQEFRNVLVGQCKIAFQKQHIKLQERVLQAVSTEEQWEPVPAVDSMFQDICTELCRSDDDAVQAFHVLAVDFDCDAEYRRQQQTQPFHGRLSNTQNGASSNEVIDENTVVQARKLFVLDPAEAMLEPSHGGGEASAAATTHHHGFVVSHSILLLLQTLQEYDQLLAHFPFLAFDILGKIYEALKLYDGQCAAMILGASAVDLGVLQTISVQHLGLASQCIACLAELTPLLQRRYYRFLPSDKLSAFVEKDFDRACKEFLSHRDAFLSKIISVVKENVDKLAKFKPDDWQQKGNSFVMEMLRELARVRKTLKSLLRTIDLHAILIPLIAICTRNLCNVSRSIPADVMAKAEGQVLSDIHLFKANVDKFGYWALRCMDAVEPQQSAKPLFRPIRVVTNCCRMGDAEADDTQESVEHFQRMILRPHN